MCEELERGFMREQRRRGTVDDIHNSEYTITPVAKRDIRLKKKGSSDIE